MTQFQWEFYVPDNIKPLFCDLPLVIHDVFRDGFGMNGWSTVEIEGALRRCGMLGLLLDEQRSVCGYALYSVPQPSFRGASLLWEDAICLRKKAQGQGLSDQAVRLALAHNPERRFGWLGGRTQNPIVMRRYTRQGVTFPFDVAYAEQEGPDLIRFLLENVSEVQRVQDFNASTGVCSGVYRRRLGDYPWCERGPFERHLLELGFDREKGDAVVVVAKLDAAQRTA